MAITKEVNEKVYKIIGSCMEVHRALGPGYPVDFYRKALEVELALKELSFEAQKSLQVLYKNVLVGTLDVDFIVEDGAVVVIRSQEALKDIEIQQVLRCLALTGCTIGLLVNFGMVRIQYKRIIPTYQRKEVRKDQYRMIGYREKGRTREGNPLI